MNSPTRWVTWEEAQKIKAAQVAAAKEKLKKQGCERRSDECSGELDQRILWAPHPDRPYGFIGKRFMVLCAYHSWFSCHYCRRSLLPNPDYDIRSYITPCGKHVCLACMRRFYPQHSTAR